jgi:hypothetical protein
MQVLQNEDDRLTLCRLRQGVRHRREERRLAAAGSGFSGLEEVDRCGGWGR